MLEAKVESIEEELNMGTIPEDIERARAIYRSITTAWKRPRFPDPPSEFLPPEKFLELAKEAERKLVARKDRDVDVAVLTRVAPRA